MVRRRITVVGAADRSQRDERSRGEEARWTHGQVEEQEGGHRDPRGPTRTYPFLAQISEPFRAYILGRHEGTIDVVRLALLALTLAACGGSGSDDPDGDDDGDGILNSRDFCPEQEGGAFDEDLDQIGDDCDRCPIAPPPETPDRDADELDSPCDPDPTEDGDRIVAWSGFNDATLPTGWKASAAWRIVGGELIVEAPAVLETLTAPLPLTSNHTAVLSRYRIDRVDAAATENAASVIAVDRRPGNTSVVSCGGSRSGGTDRLLLDTDTSNLADDFATSLFDPADLYRVASRIDNATAACALISGRETGAVQATTTGQAMTEAGLSARSATVRFSYLMVVQRPN